MQRILCFARIPLIESRAFEAMIQWDRLLTRFEGVSSNRAIAVVLDGFYANCVDILDLRYQ